MTANTLQLAAIAAELGLEGHLPECGGTGADWRRCGWCLAAVTVPEVATLLDAAADSEALLHSSAADTVPWVVAVVQLQRAADAVDPSTVTVPSARGLTHRLRRHVAPTLSRLGSRLDAAVAPGGPVEQLCDRTAGPLAAAAVQHPSNRHVLDALPTVLRGRLIELAGTLSSAVQVAALLPSVEPAHWKGMPPLRTQPEWARRPPPGSGHAATGPSHEAVLAPGSLEALVVESVTDRVTAALRELGPEMASAAPPVRLARSVHDEPTSSRTRRLTWGRAHIDWHLSLVDTGRADCWGARTEGPLRICDAPWHVAVAIEVGAEHGLLGATHNDLPVRLGDPSPVGAPSTATGG